MRRIGVDMKGKLLFVVGLGVGYVLGTRAGRERYEQIAKAADRVWNQPTVQKGVDAVKDFASEKIGDVSDVVLDNVKQFIGNQTSKGSSGSSSSSTTSRTTSSSASGTNASASKASGSTPSGSSANSGS